MNKNKFLVGNNFVIYWNLDYEKIWIPSFTAGFKHYLLIVFPDMGFKN
jgi:hypothetical protein